MKTPTKEPIVIFVIWFSFFNIPNISLITIIFTNLQEHRGCPSCLVALWLIGGYASDSVPFLHNRKPLFIFWYRV